MRSIYAVLGLVAVLCLGGAAAGAETKSALVTVQSTCASGTCAQVPANYTVRQVYYVPTTVETTYEIKSQTVTQGEPVAVKTCQPRAKLRLPRLRLFGTCCQ